MLTDFFWLGVDAARGLGAECGFRHLLAASCDVRSATICWVGAAGHALFVVAVVDASCGGVAPGSVRVGLWANLSAAVSCTRAVGGEGLGTRGSWANLSAAVPRARAVSGEGLCAKA